MAATAKQAALVAAEPPIAAPLVPAGAAGAIVTFERLAMDPNCDVDKLDRLMQLQERMLARSAKEQFNAAMSAAQKEMRPISADANNPQTKSRYASYAQLDRALRPIYTAHGFGISYDTADSHKDEHVRVLAYVTHDGGHDRTYHVDMPADGKGAKGGDVMTKTHAAGAAMSYGMRYLLKMIFNVAVGEDDIDGNDVRTHRARTASAAPRAPEGYDDWFTDMTAVSDNGTTALLAAWEQSPKSHKKWLTTTNLPGWEALKARAAKVRA